LARGIFEAWEFIMKFFINHSSKDARKIFISHSSKDASFVQALSRLIRLALNLPTDEVLAASLEDMQLESGADFESVLRDRAVNADVLVAVLSPNSLLSTYVLFELGARWGAGKKIVPLLVPGLTVDQVEPPLNSLHVQECDRPGLWNVLETIRDILKLHLAKAGSLQGPLEEVLHESIAPREALAYAVLSYVLDSGGRFALLKDPLHKKIQPPGRRMTIGEQPHEVALQMAHAELDLPIDELKRFPALREKRFEVTRIVPPPYQVQLEKNLQRNALAHYDFVYVFTIDWEKPELSVRISDEHKFDPRWYTLDEVEARKDHNEWGPHDDMPETMRAITAQLRG